MYLVRQLNASDAWIGLLYAAQTAVLVVGYFFRSCKSFLIGCRFMLLITSLYVALYPGLVLLTTNLTMIFIFSITIRIFQAGIDLVFFQRIDEHYTGALHPHLHVSRLKYSILSAVLVRILSTYLLVRIGLTDALLISTGVRLVGFVLFARQDHPIAKPFPIAIDQPMVKRSQ